MDDIDAALMAAWERVAERLRNDPGEAMRRLARMRMDVMRRPVRPWCLCLRASDTRIDADWWRVLEKDRELRYPPHTVWVGSQTLRELMKPVYIDWPGVDWTEAARRLGRHPVSLRSWIARGVLKMKKVNARSVRKRGNDVPFVYTMSPLDPNAERGRGPDAIWGDSWQGLHERVPEEFGQSVLRVPVLRRYGESATPRFRGWQFVCQGRLLALPREGPASMHDHILRLHQARTPEATIVEEDGRMYVKVPCGKRVDSMFCPLPVWTFPKAMGMDLALAVSEAGRGTTAAEGDAPAIAGEFSPGLGDSVLPGMENWTEELHARSFACATCWKVRYGTLANRHGWNEFVSHISGGLLYGQEVKRPAETRVRKERYVPQRAERLVRLSPDVVARRKRVLGFMLAGETFASIAGKVGVKKGTVLVDVRMIYRAFGVRTRAELREAVARKGVERREAV